MTLLISLSKIPLQTRLPNLQSILKNIQAFVVPSNDIHANSVPAICDKRLNFVSGFTGSSGCAVITHDCANLFTDSRYTLQANNQLDLKQWNIFNSKDKTEFQWLIENLSSINHNNKNNQKNVGFDSSLMTYSAFQKNSKKLLRHNIQLVPLDNNLIDEIWFDRPQRPNKSLIILPSSFTGISWKEKIEIIRNEMKRELCSVLVLSALDEIAWTLNLRGSDLAFSPLFYSYLIITMTDVHLFIDSYKVQSTPDLMNHLKSDNIKITIHDYTNIYKFLNNLSLSEIDGSVWFPLDSSCRIVKSLPTKVPNVLENSPVLKLKSIKNSSEVAGIKSAHILDGIALCRYLFHLEKYLDKESISEISGADLLSKFRSEEQNYVGPSFQTISAFGKHGAIIHYAPTKDSDIPITRNELYLIDSGGQYLTGTTDVTRTIHLGEATEEEKHLFTLVLQSHINLSSIIFPSGTLGSALDAQARIPLWQKGLTFEHGVGHGVGAFLNVHEGPCNFKSGIVQNEADIQLNRILTIEPGYYRPNEFGIRIENIVLVTNEAQSSEQFIPKGFLCFEPLTLVPIQKNLIVKKMLSTREEMWINQYHRRCRQMLMPVLQERKLNDVCDWLFEATEPL